MGPGGGQAIQGLNGKVQLGNGLDRLCAHAGPPLIVVLGGGVAFKRSGHSYNSGQGGPAFPGTRPARSHFLQALEKQPRGRLPSAWLPGSPFPPPFSGITACMV